ncbi:MAG: alpha/beta fold hydrolase [Salinisphaera sp.]|nr:alpha/beta fold hydrolase [Salinisphaera sp.]
MFRRFAPDAHGQDSGQGNLGQFLTNGFDRLFRPDLLVKADLTPYELLLEQDLLKLRYYPPLTDASIVVGNREIPVAQTRHRTPVVLIPPLAASTLIFDLLPRRSLVRFLLAHGFEVYLVDFGRPARRHAHLGVRDYTMDMLPAALARVREHGREDDLTLFGYCMGGLFALIYAGVHADAHIRNIVTIASPIDLHDHTLAARALMLLNLPTHLVREHTPLRIHQLNPSYVQIPGWMNSLLFKMTAPMGTLTSYWDLLVNLADRDYVETHTTTSRWFDDMLDYPGGIVQDFFVKVGLDNALNTGRLELGDTEAEFHRIQSALLAIAGETDTMVGERSARAIMDVIHSDDKTFAMAPGGHAGVFAGGKAPANSWRMAAEWLAERSD